MTGPAVCECCRRSLPTADIAPSGVCYRCRTLCSWAACTYRPQPGPAVMTVRAARFTGTPVAECPECGALCVAWDAEDLDDSGQLLCWHDGAQP